MNKNEVAKIVKDLYRNNKGKYITEKDLRKAHIAYQFKENFGKNISTGLKEIGVPCSPLSEKYSVTKEQLIEYLRELKNDIGLIPGIYEVLHDKIIYKKYTSTHFAPVIFQKRFGGFSQALKFAGFDEDKRGYKLSVGKVEDKEKEQIDNRRRFWGKGAEMHVVAELLYRGFQANNISVDEGVDVYANKNNKMFYFQVKHKDLKGSNPIEITKSTFQKKSGSGYFLVLVLLSGKEDTRKFMIIPWEMIDNWIDEHIMDDMGTKYILNIKKVGEDFKLKEVVLNRYIGNNGWDKIK